MTTINITTNTTINTTVILDKIKKNITSMLENRSYTNIIFNEEENYIKCTNLEGNEVYIFIFTNDKLNINGIKEYVSILETDNIKNSIIVYADDITSSARKFVISLTDTINIELFAFKEMMYNLTQNKYYNKHEKLNSKDAAQFISTYGKDIPVLLKNDIVVRYFNFQKGDIIRIYRNNGTISYRILK